MPFYDLISNQPKSSDFSGGGEITDFLRHSYDGGHRPSITSSAAARILGTPEANVPVASPGIAGESVTEVPRKLVWCYIEHMVATARDALARGIRILPAVRCVVGIGLE